MVFSDQIFNDDPKVVTNSTYQRQYFVVITNVIEKFSISNDILWSLILKHNFFFMLKNALAKQFCSFAMTTVVGNNKIISKNYCGR